MAIFSNIIPSYSKSGSTVYEEYKGILLRWDKLSISSMYLLNLSISGLLFSLTMPIWILQIISGQVRWFSLKWVVFRQIERSKSMKLDGQVNGRTKIFRVG